MEGCRLSMQFCEGGNLPHWSPLLLFIGEGVARAYKPNNAVLPSLRDRLKIVPRALNSTPEGDMLAGLSRVRYPRQHICLLPQLRRGNSTSVKFKPESGSLSIDNSSITVPFLQARFPFVWLRDSCQSTECVHPSTASKLHRTSDIPLDVKPLQNGVLLNGDGLHVQWNDGHSSFYPHSFLERHASPVNLAKFHHDILPKTWDASTISKSDNLFIPYQSLKSPSGLRDAIDQLVQFGLLFISGVPNKETSNEKCELRELAERFGEIRPTFYGQMWDVVNRRNSINIAYTNLDLGLHMDLLYFQHPPRYQILHCLRNRVVGGTSVFVDALSAATTLRNTHPRDFDVLTSTPVPFHYVNDGHHLHYEHPTIQLSEPSPLISSNPQERSISYINYSPPFQAPLLLSSTPPPFYPALSRFAKLLNDPTNTYEYTLKEGDAVIFDNRRVLHARTAFTDAETEKDIKEGETNRWLKGCYFEADTLLDRGRVLRAQSN